MKILVVEDEPVLQRLYSRVLTEAGYEVTVLNDGTYVLETAKEEKPGLVLLDVMLPNMNGLDVLRALKGDTTTNMIPVIMLSAHEDDSFLFQAMQIGASRYLLKSAFEPEAIVGMVKETLEKAAA